jgi:hypothetical protein
MTDVHVEKQDIKNQKLSSRPSSDHSHPTNPMSHLENTGPNHNIMELFQSHTRTQPSTPIRLNDHIFEQIIINRVLLELARDAPQMAQGNRPVRAARE